MRGGEAGQHEEQTLRPGHSRLGQVKLLHTAILRHQRHRQPPPHAAAATTRVSHLQPQQVVVHCGGEAVWLCEGGGRGEHGGLSCLKWDKFQHCREERIKTLLELNLITPFCHLLISLQVQLLAGTFYIFII